MALSDFFQDWTGYAETDIPLPPAALAKYLIFPAFHFLILDPWLLSNVGTDYTINSGYRDPSHNTEVNGAADSAHLFGVAADISTGQDNSVLAASWEDDLGGWASGAENHLHVNLGRAKAWEILRIELAISVLLALSPILHKTFKGRG